MSRLEAILKWWKFGRVVFYLVDRSLQWSFKATVVPNQLGGRDVLSRFAGKEDRKRRKRRQNSVILLVNDRSKPLVCYVLSRFWKLKLASKINRLNGQKLSSLTLTPYLWSIYKSAVFGFRSIHNALQSTTKFTALQCQLVNVCICMGWILGHKIVRIVKFWDSWKCPD